MEEKKRHTFEYNVLIVACLIGLLRSIIEVVSDFMAVELLPNFYLDITFLLVFAGTLILLRSRRSFKLLLFVFYLPFIAQLIIMFLDGRGLSYAIENNVFAGLIILTFTTRGNIPIYLNGTLLVGIIISLIVIEYQHDLLNTFTSLNSNAFNFLFSSIGAIAFTLYAKSEFNKSKKRLAQANQSLLESNQALEIKNAELLARKERLEALTVDLDNRIKKDSKRLRSQKEQVEEYLSITVTELFDAYQSTIDSIERFDDQDNDMVTMMAQSGENLKQEMESLRVKIEESINEVD